MQNIKLKNFACLKETYEEAKEKYNYEQGRFQSIENKTTSFLTLNSILITILAIPSALGYYFFIPTIFFLFLSICYSFKVYALRKGSKPGKKYEDFYQYAKMNKKPFYDKLLLAYTTSLITEEEINKQKIRDLDKVIFYSKIAWIAFIIGFLVFLIV